MTRACLLSAFSLALLLVINSVRAADPKDSPKDPPKAPPIKADPAQPPSKADLEKKFEETMTGATLVGHYTINGQKASSTDKEEHYTIEKVAKLQGSTWLFTSRIQYGDHDVSVPLPLQVEWAGDTPVIELTQFPVPGLGTFTARVVIYDGQYAGLWNGGGDHGGSLFGKVVKKGDAAEAKPAGDKPDPQRKPVQDRPFKKGE